MKKKMSFLYLIILLLSPVFSNNVAYATTPVRSSDSIKIPAEHGIIILKELEIHSRSAQSPVISGVIVNNTSRLWEIISFKISLKDNTSKKIYSQEITLFNLKAGEVRSIKKPLSNVEKSDSFSLDITSSGGSLYKGYIEVPHSAVLPYKAGWTGQKAVFVSSVQSLYSDPIKWEKIHDIEPLLNKKFTIKGLYKEAPDSSYGNYIWKLADDTSGAVVWYKDEHYRRSVTDPYFSPDYYKDSKPFLIDAEIQNNDQRLNEYRVWIGKPVWVNLNENDELKEQKINHLEKLVIADVNANITFSQMTIGLKRENGAAATWIYTSMTAVNKSFDSILKGDFYLTSPYEMYPDWSDETWNLIQQHKVQIGWDKDKCIMSWGEPWDIEKTGAKEQWIYGDSCLYFENGILQFLWEQ